MALQFIIVTPNARSQIVCIKNRKMDELHEIENFHI